MMWEWDFISNHSPELGSTVPKAPAKKRKMALWLVGITCPKKQVTKWLMGYGFHDLQADEEQPNHRVE